MISHLIGFGHAAVRLEVDDARAQNLVDFLFHFTCSDAAYLPYTTFRVAADGESGKFAVYRDGVLIREDDSGLDWIRVENHASSFNTRSAHFNP